MTSDCNALRCDTDEFKCQCGVEFYGDLRDNKP